MDAVNSVELLFKKDNTELPHVMRGSVETLRSGAEMPKRKSGQQTSQIVGGQGNLMLDAKPVVGRSIRPRRIL